MVLRLNSKVGSKDEAAIEEEQVGPAKSQANPFVPRKTKEKQTKNTPPLIDTFQSSNIDAVAYDPTKKQMWVRFLGKDLYTYFDVPLAIYRGFWSAPSKGHYFWEKIRKNKRIKYQKLTASLTWVPLKQTLSLNASVQANHASIARSLKNKLKQRHPEWNIQPELITLFNGFRLLFDDHSIEICRYSTKVRVNIKNEVTGKIDFSTTSETDTQKVVNYILARLESKLQSLAASRTNTTNTTNYAVVMQLVEFLKKGIPEAKWKESVTPLEDGYQIESDACNVALTRTKDEVLLTLVDKQVSPTQEHVTVLSEDDLLTTGLTFIMAALLQGLPEAD